MNWIKSLNRRISNFLNHTKRVVFFPTFLFLLLGIGQLYAQSFCETPPTSSNIGFDNAAMRGMTAAGPFHIRIYVHVIRRTNGTGGQTTTDVDAALSFLDLDFNPHSIFFEWDGCIDYIDSDSWFAGPGGNPTGIYSVNNHYDGVDIYLFPATANSPGGRANGVGNSSEFWVSGT